MQAIRDNRRFVLIGLVILVLLCLVGVLVYRIFVTPGEEVTGGTTPTPPPAEATTGTLTAATPAVEAVTPTPTRVVAETPTTEATVEATTTPDTPTPTPATRPATATPASGGAATTTTTTRQVSRIEQLLKNGDFEEGFIDGLGRSWSSFKNDSAVVVFSSESPGPYVKSGSGAQRITVSQASQGDRYAGIYQQVPVTPNQAYTLTLNGMIRSGLGDIQASSYGYRMQYAIDAQGGTNWLNVPRENWIELPWDEQKLHTPEVKFLTYTTTVTAASPNLTLYVRAWNKWPDPGEVQYTLDSLSLIGSLTVTETVTGQQPATMIDKPLPTTGSGEPAGLANDGRFWGAMLILLMLAAGAVYRARWGW